jgi:hypothetical protein
VTEVLILIIRLVVMAVANDSALIEKLRTWRRDASSLHQYDAAAFVGDKILSITSISVQLESR